MASHVKVDICVIGAGSGGLSVAAGASQMGATTALIEKGKMGGDCLNYGCVPSKALLAAAHAAERARRAHRLGIGSGEVTVDAGRVYGHVRDTIAAIAPNDSAARFEALGVKVIQGQARFTGPRTVVVDGNPITARRFVVATGSQPFVPPIEGLDGVPYLTNETIFDLQALPRHLIIIGGGPIGVEMAQAHRHLGAEVTVLEMASMMPRDDPELVDVLRTRLKADGVDVREGVEVTRIGREGGNVIATLRGNGGETRVEGSHILVAAGRRPTVEGLDLEAAGIEFSATGIKVDARLRTTNKRVFAIGDVVGRLEFTHAAGYHAGIVIRNALFRLPAKIDVKAFPWVTYTMPELAQVGLIESQAKHRPSGIRILRWPFAENDRAQTDGDRDGLIKVVTTPKGRILGAGIVGPRAGELIHTWVLAIGRKMKIGAIANMIAPYPTLGEVGKRAAGSFYTPSLFSEGTKKIVRLLVRLG